MENLEALARECDDWLEVNDPTEVFAGYTLVGAFALRHEGGMCFGFAYSHPSGSGLFYRPKADFLTTQHRARIDIPWERALPVKNERFRARRPDQPAPWLPPCEPTQYGWVYLVCDGFARSGPQQFSLTGSGSRQCQMC